MIVQLSDDERDFLRLLILRAAKLDLHDPTTIRLMRIYLKLGGKK